MFPNLYTLREIVSSPATRQASWQDLRLPTGQREVANHLAGAIDWLCRAQDAATGGGVSYGFDLRRGWLAPYPETTGYIIPSFLNYARAYEVELGPARAEELRQRARRMAHWLTTVQMECGALPGGTTAIEPQPTVFNTGQVLQGWCHAYREFKDEALRAALVRAAQWLVEVQDEDGCWRQGLSPLTLQTPATYNVRSAAALLEAGILLDDAKFRAAAIKNFDWVLTQQTGNGWFTNNCLTDNDKPLTHTIGYTLEGLLIAAESLQAEKYLAAVRLAFEPIRRVMRPDGFLNGRLNANWQPQVAWNCLTGSCQIALVWFRLGQLTNEPPLLARAERLLSFVKRTQLLPERGAENVIADRYLQGVVGGIKGSYPIWGGYDPFRYPNWAAKFFIDALLASENKAVSSN